MTRCLLSIFLFAAITLITPAVASTDISVEMSVPEHQDITITVTEASIRVTGAGGQMLFVYNLAGVRVVGVKIESSDKHFDLNLPKGCYIVQVGKVARKIAIR